MIVWSAFGSLGEKRRRLESQETRKQLRSVKDDQLRKITERKLEASIAAVHDTAVEAAEALSRLGPLLPPKVLSPVDQKMDLNDSWSPLVDFLLDAERRGYRLLRWILAFHFEHLLPVYLDCVYQREAAEAVLFSHALYDQVPLL